MDVVGVENRGTIGIEEEDVVEDRVGEGLVVWQN
jgi:hypothetical protein